MGFPKLVMRDWEGVQVAHAMQLSAPRGLFYSLREMAGPLRLGVVETRQDSHRCVYLAAPHDCKATYEVRRGSENDAPVSRGRVVSSVLRLVLICFDWSLRHARESDTMLLNIVLMVIFFSRVFVHHRYF